MSVEEILQIITSWGVQLPVWATVLISMIWKIVQARILNRNNRNNSTNAIRLKNNEAQVASLQQELSVAESTNSKLQEQVNELQDAIEVIANCSRNEKIRSLAKSRVEKAKAFVEEVATEVQEEIIPIVQEEVKKVKLKRNE